MHILVFLWTFWCFGAHFGVLMHILVFWCTLPATSSMHNPTPSVNNHLWASSLASKYRTVFNQLLSWYLSFPEKKTKYVQVFGYLDIFRYFEIFGYFWNVVQCCGVILEIHLWGGQEIPLRYLEHNTSLGLRCHCKKSHKPTANFRDSEKIYGFDFLCIDAFGQKDLVVILGLRPPGALHKKREEGWGEIISKRQRGDFGGNGQYSEYSETDFSFPKRCDVRHHW